MKVVTQFNFVPNTKKIVFSKEDRAVTVPDQAYSLTQLIERHRAGILTDTAYYKEPVYLDTDDFDDEDMEKLSQSDLVDQEAYMARASEREERPQSKPEKEDDMSANTKAAQQKTDAGEGMARRETEQPPSPKNKYVEQINALD